MKKIILELTPKQLIALQKMAFIGDMIINGMEIEDFDIDIKSTKSAIIDASVKTGNLGYITKYKAGGYDFDIQKSMELYGSIEDYVEIRMGEDILEILTENTLKRLKKDESEYEKIAEEIDKHLEEHGYKDIYLSIPKLTNPIFL